MWREVAGLPARVTVGAFRVGARRRAVALLALALACVGLVASASAEIVEDTTPPEVSAVVSPGAVYGEWRKAPANVTLSAVDASSAVDAISYAIDGAPLQVYGGTFGVPEGTSTVSFLASDTVGNVSATQTVEIKSDGTPPVTTPSWTPTYGEWCASPVYVTLDAVDAGAGVKRIDYLIDFRVGGTYSGPLELSLAGAAGAVNLQYKSRDQLDNIEQLTPVNVMIDGAAPSTPDAPIWTGITPYTVSLSWAASTDWGAGVAFYEIYSGESLVDTTSATAHTVMGLVPGSEHDLTVIAVDNVGNRTPKSAPVHVHMPLQRGEADVDTVGSVVATVAVPGIGDVTVAFSEVTTPGRIVVTPIDELPAPLDSALRSLAPAFDVQFSGAFAADSTVTIGAPYDRLIGAGQIGAAEVMHWSGGAWESLAASPDLVAHRYSVDTTSLSPFALVESATRDATATLTMGIGTPDGTAAEVVVPFGGKATLAAGLTDSTGARLDHKSVLVERFDSAASTWTVLGPAIEGAVAGEYRLQVGPTDRTIYRMRFEGDAYDSTSVSQSRSVKPHAWVGTPVMVPTIISRYYSYAVSGYLKPRHVAGTSPVRIYRWRWVTNRWVAYTPISAKASSISSYSKYTASVRLPYAGKWKLRAYAPADTAHADAWSSGYDYVTVR